MELAAVAAPVWDSGASAGGLFRMVEIKKSLNFHHWLEIP